jgi:hypothetical protein
MLDALRNDASSYYDDDDDFQELSEPAEKPKQFLDMTPFQRFVIALLLLIVTCILSAACLLVTERVALFL